eukprot:TRINITY_DN25943_c0_g1_i1.p1 TRINITY_DN25943_c0_g1~~TRINITY_DN25943_c0_g1_i1.p1  ORF type:complete len:431 (-),score=85.65 TRINITY_DN25943_c0_g1_i1:159-1451(-)
MAELQTSMQGLLVVLCRSSYYISLLGLKIPLGLLARASHARYVLAFLKFVVMPLNLYTHISLLPKVATLSYGSNIWQALMALWVTIPLLVVGSVILQHVRARTPMMAFFGALVTVACCHWFVIPVLQPTLLGTLALQLMFAFFEDGSILGWIWCLQHVVRIQDFIASRGAAHKCPIEAPKGPEDRPLVVGNAPTVMGQPLGAEIDKFADVVRFNSYVINNPPYTGTKGTYHFCNGRNLPEKHFKAVLPIFNASLTHAVYLFMPHMEDAKEICERLENCKATVWFVEEDRLLALRKKIGMNLWQIPSSGMVAIDSFLSQHEKVTLHGFNFFSGKQIHYFQESPLQLITSWLERFVTHNPPQEKRWVQRLMKEGRAIFLADAVNGDDQPSEILQDAAESPKEKMLDGEARRRNRPGILRTIFKDGLPSQFSI